MTIQGSGKILPATLGNAGVLIACCLPSVWQTLTQRDSSVL